MIKYTFDNCIIHIYMVDTYYICKCALHFEWISIKYQGKQWNLENFSDGALLIGIVIKHKYHITCINTTVYQAVFLR
jgi:hypothetical protein